jgi:hypothetical protein
LQECTSYQDRISNLEDLDLFPIACNTLKKEALFRVEKEDMLVVGECMFASVMLLMRPS